MLARRTTTALSLQLAAPRLILPENLEDPRSQVLILDMGAITMKSSTAPPSAAESAAAKAATTTKRKRKLQWLSSFLERATRTDCSLSVRVRKYL